MPAWDWQIPGIPGGFVNPRERGLNTHTIGCRTGFATPSAMSRMPDGFATPSAMFWMPDGVCNPVRNVSDAGRGLQPRPQCFVNPRQHKFRTGSDAGRGLQPRPQCFVNPRQHKFRTGSDAGRGCKPRPAIGRQSGARSECSPGSGSGCSPG